tara:strand:+ start:315 stop:542 length:228 start_codon:yes stop_codon:yes gene_type:complete
LPQVLHTLLPWVLVVLAVEVLALVEVVLILFLEVFHLQAVVVQAVLIRPLIRQVYQAVLVAAVEIMRLTLLVVAE